MKNTGITYTSAERSPVILPEMAELLPPLSAEQLDALETDLVNNGCYSPIIVNEDMVIIDGHNRQALCEKHGLPYTMAVFSFEDLLEAKQWALDTQKGRRNLEKWELGKIALKLKPEIEAKAKANMAAGGQNFRPSEAEEGSATLPNLPSVEKAVDTRKELAEAVGLGERTMGKVMQIDENAPEVIKEALDKKELSINKGYDLTRQLQDLPEEQREQEMCIRDSQNTGGDAITFLQQFCGKSFPEAVEYLLTFHGKARDCLLYTSSRLSPPFKFIRVRSSAG